MTDDLAQWLTQVWDEQEWWATEASRRELGGSTPTGEHWHWQCSDDHDVEPDPLTSEILACRVDDNWGVSLRSREEYPTSSVGPLPHFALPGCEEVSAVVAGHIIRHDPASVLARIAADRQILALHHKLSQTMKVWLCPSCSARHGYPCPTLRLLALPYADRPGYQDSWKP